MIAALMLYSTVISIAFALAAVAGEYLLRLARRPGRLVWTLAMLAAVGFSATRFKSGLAAAAPHLSSAVSSSDPGLASQPVRTAAEAARTLLGATRTKLTRMKAARALVAPGSALTRLDEPLLVGWTACSIVGLIAIVFAARRLARPRPPWSTMTVAGVPVLLSHDLGPAAIGLFRYRIVLPRWALELPSVERDLVVAHEREHATARDPSLLFVATVLVALMPWNAALWWMARRLRFAIELDCDARVLHRQPNPTAYGALLLAVSERMYGGVVPIAAFAEPVSLLERRIAAFTSRMPRFALARAIAAGTVALALIAVACETPEPTNARNAAPGPSNAVAVVAARPAQAGPRADKPAVSTGPKSTQRKGDTARSRASSLHFFVRGTVRSSASGVLTRDFNVTTSPPPAVVDTGIRDPNLSRSKPK